MNENTGEHKAVRPVAQYHDGRLTISVDALTDDGWSEIGSISVVNPEASPEVVHYKSDGTIEKLSISEEPIIIDMSPVGGKYQTDPALPIKIVAASPRDEQFAGFAEALLDEMFGEFGYIDFNVDDTEVIEHFKLKFAQRAYDLVDHSIKAFYSTYNAFINIADIPDMPSFKEK